MEVTSIMAATFVIQDEVDLAELLAHHPTAIIKVMACDYGSNCYHLY